MEPQNRQLIEQLQSPEEADRLFAVQDMVADGDPKWVSHLVQRIGREDSAAVKDSLVFALSNLDCRNDFPALFALFSHQDAFVRNAAMTIFGSQKQEAIAFLTAQLDHADREVRKLVLDALYATDTIEARMAIRAGLQDRSVNVRITAVEYLGELMDTDSLPDILELLKSTKEPMLISAILECLAVLGDEASAAQAVAVLCPDQDITRVEKVYLPEIMNLMAKKGCRDCIETLLNHIPDPMAYAVDILAFIGHARKRFPDFGDSEFIFGHLMDLAGSSHVNTKVRYGACDLILSLESADPEQVKALGERLVQEETMKTAGERLLSTSGNGTEEDEE